MKKLIACLSLVTACALAVFTLSSCNAVGGAYFEGVYAAHENLAANASYTDADKDTSNSFSLSGKGSRRNNFVTVDLGAVKTFNTITLQETGKAVTRFSIYASNTNGEDYVHIYQGDTIEDARTCFVGEIAYRYLRIFAVEVTGNYNINTLGVYNIKNANAKDLRVSAYLVVADVDEKYDLSTLEAVTDIILFGSATLDKNGNIRYVYGYDANDNEITDNGERYKKSVEIIKAAVADRDDVNFIVDIHLPYGNDNADIYESQTTNLETSVNSIKNFVTEYELDGYDIDYEYPNNNKQWRAYNAFLLAVNAAMPDKILSIATSRFALKFDKETVAAIDRVQYMLYDDYDVNGYQSAFPITAAGIQALKDCGFAESQIDMGVPTYSRPTDNFGFWGEYKSYADKLGKYDNLIYANVYDHDGYPLTTPQYFNSYQMISDKTAFAIDAGVGGIMIFRIGCDLPYSETLCLARAIAETKAAKAA